MNALVNKVCFSDKYYVVEHNERYVLLDTITNKTCRLDPDQYELWNKIYQLRSDRVGLEQLIDTVGQDLLLYLLRRGLITLKPIEIKADFTGKPVAAYWSITDSCNFRCRYCYANCEGIRNDIKINEILSLEQCYGIVDSVKEYGFRELVLTGGEPLLEPKVFEIAKYAKEKGLYCGLLTNGSLISKFDIEEFRVFHYIKISLDGHEDEINDAVRGEGTCQRILEGIKLLRDHDMKVDISTVITKLNRDHIKELMEIMYRDFGITTHTLTNHIPLGRGAKSELGCSFDEIKQCDDIIMHTKFKMQEENFFSVIQDVFYPEGRKNCCGMGVSEILINEKADVYPCRMTYTDEFYLGNLLKDNLKDILSRMVDISKKLTVDCIESCKDCEVKYLCGGGCRMYHQCYTDSIYESYPEVCDIYKRQLHNLLLVKNGINPME